MLCYLFFHQTQLTKQKQANIKPALQINIIPLPVTMIRKIEKPPVKLNVRQSH